MQTLVLQPVERTADDVRAEIARRRRLFDRPIGCPAMDGDYDAWCRMAECLGGVCVAVHDDRGVSTYVFRPNDQAVVIRDLEDELAQLVAAEQPRTVAPAEAA
jgi:hypothetical protein